MRKRTTTILAAALLAGAAVAAQAQSVTPGNPATRSGNTAGSGASMMSDTQIRQQLQTQGYTVQSLKHEGNYVEAKVAKGGQTAQLRVDPQTGAVSQSEDKDEDND